MNEMNDINYFAYPFCNKNLKNLFFQFTSSMMYKGKFNQVTSPFLIFQYQQGSYSLN
jgi:hypothetical protein